MNTKRMIIRKNGERVKGWLKRLVACMMLLSFLLSTSPLASFAALPKHGAVPPKAMPPHGIKKASKKAYVPVATKLEFSAQPSDLEIMRARVLPEALIPLHIDAVEGENVALASALISLRSNSNSDDTTALTNFISAFPQSRWRAAAELNLGIKCFETGYLTQAMESWKSAWEKSKKETEKAQKAIADESVSRLVLLEARLGRKEELESYLSTLSKRSVTGSAEQKINAARKGDSCMNKNPGIAYKCGPFALEGVLSALSGKSVHSPELYKVQSSVKGTNLAQLKKWSNDLGLHYQIAKKDPGAPAIVPSVMHWKLGHFAALMKKEKDRYITKDPTFSIDGKMALSQAALDVETDGYFLVPGGTLPSGWNAVTDSEAEKVWGKGVADGVAPPCGSQPAVSDSPGGGGSGGDGGSNQHNGSCQAPGASPSNGPGIGGMAKAYAYSMQATLNIKDVPLGYHPPVGPDMSFGVNYNDLEYGQPGTFTFTNLGPDWSFNWLCYLTVDGSGNATIRTAGGGAEYYAYSDGSYAPGLYTTSQLTVSDGVYQLQSPDGSVQVYSQPDGSGNIFMTEMIDPQGNAATISFDDNYRITAITDAIGQQSTLTYGSDTYGDPGFYVLTQITDPFERSCSFAYDETYTYLQSITDVIGIESKFHYTTGAADSSFIDRMTTPYGTTSFRAFTEDDERATGLQFVYPDGTTSVIVNEGLGIMESYYWTREQMSLYPSDFVTPTGFDIVNTTNCTTTGWCFTGDDGTAQSAIPQYITPPLDSGVIYTYPGGETTYDEHYYLAGVGLPSSANVDSSIWQYEYNAQGNLTQTIDPVGRQFSYTYADNGIDLLEKEQTQTETPDINGIWASYSQHLPGSYKDGSGQTTTFTYNSFGQITTKTDPASNVWTMTYDDNGYLTQVQGPLSGSNDVSTISYDGYGRAYQTTDSEGYILTYSYDQADRLTQITFPDGTSTQMIYDKLDAVLLKDRIGRWTQRSFDSMEQVSFEIDPLGRKTSYVWCDCGSLMSLTDPSGNKTQWEHDIEGRVTTKTCADGSPWSYVYDPAGRLFLITDPLSQQTDLYYNLDNTLNYKGGPDDAVYYSYDPNYRRLTSVENDNWGTYTYSYNPYITDPDSTTTGAGELSEVTNSVIDNSDITYTYDVLGRVTNRSINGSSDSTSWAYDAINRVTAETNPLGEFDYSYVDDAYGYSKGTNRLSAISYPNGQVTNFNWFGNQGDQRLQGIINLKSDGTCLSQFAYGYDPAWEITAWQQQQGPEANQVSKLGYDLAGQLVSAQAGGNGLISPTYQSQNYYSYDQGGNRIGAQQFTQSQAEIGGTITAGDVVTLIVSDAGLSGGQETVIYTVMSGDDASAIASGLASAITADSNLGDIGIQSNTSGAFVFIYSASVNITSYAYSVNSGGTEYVIPGEYGNSLVNFTAVGTPTVGDVLTITVNDPALSGGQESVSYTVQSGDTLASIAEQLSYAIYSDSNLSSLGVNSYYVESSGQLLSESPNVSTYTQSVSANATEGIVFSLNTNQIHTGNIGGTPMVGDVLTLTVYDSALSGGSEAVTYTVGSGDDASAVASGLAAAVEADSSLSPIMSASSNGALLSLESFSLNVTSYRATTSSGATETIVLGTNNSFQTFANYGGRQFQYNNVNELVSVSPGGVTPFQGTTNKAVQSASVASNVISIQQAPLTSSTYSLPEYSSATESILFSWPLNGNSTGTVSGTITTGDVLTFLINNSELPGGQEQIAYTVLSGDTLDSIASALAAVVNGDANLTTLGITATSSSASISIEQPSTIYSWTESGGATEYLSFGPNNNGNVEIEVEGSITAGDILTITATNGALSGGESSASYTVQSGDSFISVATGLAAALNANSSLSALSILAANTSPAVLKWSQAFTADAPISSYTPIEMSAVDGGSNTAGTDYTMYVQGANSVPSYDFNGNMTSDGTNTYTWDAENRLTQITYPGDGNYSQFAYDGFGRCVQIIETNNESITSTKQFVWSGGVRCEARDADGLMLSQYFRWGQTLNDANYFYTRDHLGSVRELTDSTENIQAQYNYDPYGRVSKSQGSLDSDFEYAGYYNHGPSGLNQAVHRFYSPSLARWINRDPIGEQGGLNLYGYVSNEPTVGIDPSGHFLFLVPLAVEVGTITAEIVAGGLIGVGIGIGLTLPSPGSGAAAGNSGGNNNNGPKCKKRDCDDVRRELYEAMEVLADRLADLRTDKLDLYNVAYNTKNPNLPPNSGTWTGHLEQAEGWQNRIRNLIDEARKMKCPIPSAAYGFASTKFPNQPRGN
jgi:RHS repeat-associated protein